MHALPRRHRRGRVTSSAPTSQTADLHLLARRDGEESWRALRILAEFVDGFEALQGLPPAITVFGSARTRPEDPEYELARAVGRALADDGFAVITGGGGGIMEAASRVTGCAGHAEVTVATEQP